jgi:hypothetical protein
LSKASPLPPIGPAARRRQATKVVAVGTVTSSWWQAAIPLLLALVTAAVGGALCQRTDVIPAYLLCLCVGLYAAVAPATDRPAPLAAPVFAATTHAWLTAAISALHR